MPFIPHTDNEIADMLADIGINSIDDLFAEIPKDLQVTNIQDIPNAINECQIQRIMQQRARKDLIDLNFIGAGAYEHHIPAIVWNIASRGEFLTSYTPYQAEASQGTLQLLYEYQTMIANLMALDVSNASLYEGASALTEAIFMAVRHRKKANHKKILIPQSVNPMYRDTVKTLVHGQNIEIIEIPFNKITGKTTLQGLEQSIGSADFISLVVPQPNFFGVLEDVDDLTNWAHMKKASVIGLVNPLAMALLQPPGVWGKSGADIACGEAQCLGIPLASGGPYIGFLACNNEYIRQVPGRIVGQTQDLSGKRGFTLTLQAREQHIRRSKATSNICTNQCLLAVAVAIYLSVMGTTGLQNIAQKCHQNTMYLKRKLSTLPGIKVKFNSPYFHEILMQFQQPVAKIQTTLAQQGIQVGFNISTYYPGLNNSLLLCATETKTHNDLDYLIEKLQDATNF